MLRFRLGGVVVQVHFSHLLITGLLAFSFAGASLSGGSVVARPQSSAWQYTAAALGWLLLISSTVLLHELGQAWALRRYGLTPTVHLIGIGGRTMIATHETLDASRTVLSTLAGPLLGIMVCLTAETVSKGLAGLETAPDAQTVIAVFGWANLGWAGFNLLPVPPLAGSRVLTTVLQRAFGPPGFLASQLVSLGFAGLVAVAGLLLLRNPFIALLAAMFAFRSLAMIAAYRKGLAPPGAAPPPIHHAGYDEAESLYRDGKLDDARVRLAQLAEQNVPPALRSKVHLLWGWIEVKNGQGRAALDHFSQVQGMTVAPQALAAAFSLIGDDTRALPLWINAAESGELTLRAELGGCLVRLGRELDARKLPELRFTQSLLAAERVYFLRGEYAKAGGAAEAAFQEEPSADLAYDAACGYARASDPEGALRMLQLASQNGFSKLEVVEADSDLSSLKAHPGFLEWLDALKQKVAAAPLENSTVLTKG